MGLDVHLGQLVVCHGSRRSSGSAGGLPWVSTFIWVSWWSAMGIDINLGQLVDCYVSRCSPGSAGGVCHAYRHSPESAVGLPWVSTFIWVGWWSAMGIDVHLGQLVDCYVK